MSFEMNKDQLRQSLLELHYDLLDAEESQKLREAIATDPEVAAEWATTLALAGKLANAAKFEGANAPRLDLSRLITAVPSANGSAEADGETSDSPALAELVDKAADEKRQLRIGTLLQLANLKEFENFNESSKSRRVARVCVCVCVCVKHCPSPSQEEALR